jgi:hypothetical protein
MESVILSDRYWSAKNPSTGEDCSKRALGLLATGNMLWVFKELFSGAQSSPSFGVPGIDEHPLALQAVLDLGDVLSRFVN